MFLGKKKVVIIKQEPSEIKEPREAGHNSDY